MCIHVSVRDECSWWEFKNTPQPTFSGVIFAGALRLNSSMIQLLACWGGCPHLDQANMEASLAVSSDSALNKSLPHTVTSPA